MGTWADTKNWLWDKHPVNKRVWILLGGWIPTQEDLFLNGGYFCFLIRGSNLTNTPFRKAGAGFGSGHHESLEIRKVARKMTSWDIKHNETTFRLCRFATFYSDWDYILYHSIPYYTIQYYTIQKFTCIILYESVHQRRICNIIRMFIITSRIYNTLLTSHQVRV